MHLCQQYYLCPGEEPDRHNDCILRDYSCTILFPRTSQQSSMSLVSIILSPQCTADMGISFPQPTVVALFPQESPCCPIIESTESILVGLVRLSSRFVPSLSPSRTMSFCFHSFPSSSKRETASSWKSCLPQPLPCSSILRLAI